MQGLPSEYMYVVAPWSEFQPQQYRFADYAAYFRKVESVLSTAMAAPAKHDTYPDPIKHRDICRWREFCDKRRRDDRLCSVCISQKILTYAETLAISGEKSSFRPYVAGYKRAPARSILGLMRQQGVC